MFLLLLKECAVFKRQPASAKGRNSISISRIYMFAGKLISQLQSERMWNWEDNLLFAYTFLSKCDEAAFPPPPSRHFPNSKPLLRTFLAIIPLLLLLLPARFSLERDILRCMGRGGKREIWRWHVFASPSSPSPSFSNPNPRLYSSSFSSFSSFPVTLRPCHRQSHKKGAGNGQDVFLKRE